MNTEFETGLSDAQIEQLACLAEEAGEIVLAVGKILRHGYESTNPFDISCKTNRQQLETEVGQIGVAIERLFRAGELNEDNVLFYEEAKKKTVHQWLHFNKE